MCQHLDYTILTLLLNEVDIVSKISDERMDSIDEHYIDHEVRIRLLEHLAKQINNKMNIGLTLIAGSLVIPMVLKFLGWL